MVVLLQSVTARRVSVPERYIGVSETIDELRPLVGHDEDADIAAALEEIARKRVMKGKGTCV